MISHIGITSKAILAGLALNTAEMNANTTLPEAAAVSYVDFRSLKTPQRAQAVNYNNPIALSSSTQIEGKIENVVAPKADKQPPVGKTQDDNGNLTRLIFNGIAGIGALGFIISLFKIEQAMRTSNIRVKNARGTLRHEDECLDATKKEKFWQRLNLISAGVYLAPVVIPKLLNIPVEIPNWWSYGLLVLAGAQALFTLPHIFPKR